MLSVRIGTHTHIQETTLTIFKMLILYSIKRRTNFYTITDMNGAGKNQCSVSELLAVAGLLQVFPPGNFAASLRRSASDYDETASDVLSPVPGCQSC